MSCMDEVAEQSRKREQRTLQAPVAGDQLAPELILSAAYRYIIS